MCINLNDRIQLWVRVVLYTRKCGPNVRHDMRPSFFCPNDFDHYCSPVTTDVSNLPLSLNAVWFAEFELTMGTGQTSRQTDGRTFAWRATRNAAANSGWPHNNVYMYVQDVIMFSSFLGVYYCIHVCYFLPYVKHMILSCDDYTYLFTIIMLEFEWSLKQPLFCSMSADSLEPCYNLWIFCY